MLAPHGADDEFSPTYSVERVIGTAPSGASNSGNIVITPEPVRLTLNVLAPTVTITTPSTWSS
jgi:hypothetical protein